MNIKFTLLSLCLLATLCSHAQTGSLKIRNDGLIQLGYSKYNTLTFGQYTGSPNNGRYAIESISGGLNFWKPWPSPNAGNYYLFLREDKNVGIGTMGSSSIKLDVNGSIRSTQSLIVSDGSLKRNIQPVSNSLGMLLRLKPVTYDMFSVRDTLVNGDVVIDYGDDSEYAEIKTKTIEVQNSQERGELRLVKRVGFVAQEVAEIFPEIVIPDENGLLAISYDELIPYLVDAIKELKAEVDALKANKK